MNRTACENKHLLSLYDRRAQSLNCRSQWPRGLRHELSSPARVLGSRVRTPLKAWMSVLCACILFVDRGLATGSSPVQGVLSNAYRINKLKK
jgi:hypothetical protein